MIVISGFNKWPQLAMIVIGSFNKWLSIGYSCDWLFQ